MNNLFKITTGWLAILVLAGCSLPGATLSPPKNNIDEIVTAAALTAFSRLTAVAAIPSETLSRSLEQTAHPATQTPVEPTSVAVAGQVITNVTVFSIPQKSKIHAAGELKKGQSVNIIARNDSANWLYVVFNGSPSVSGWVLASTINMSADMEGLLSILVYRNGFEASPIMLPPFIFSVKGTPLPPGTPPSDWSKFGTLTQRVQVFVGPSTGFLAIGVLDPGQLVTFRGRVQANEWVQIDYPSGPQGRGWILTQFVLANDGYGGLPYFDLLGTPVTPPGDTPTAQPGSQATQFYNMAPMPTPTPPFSFVEAVVANPVNVRSGPAGTYSVIGELHPQEKVYVSGVTTNLYWYKIMFSESPDGFGWVSAQYLHVVGNPRAIPYFYNEGTKIPLP